MPTSTTRRPTSLEDVRRQKLELLAELREARKRREAAAAEHKNRLYRKDPVRWVQERAKMFVWSKQREILESVRDNRRTAVQSCHGAGKSHNAALTVDWWLSVHPPGEAFVVTSAPTYAQVRAILWRYIRQIHRKASLPGRVNQTEWHLDGELVAFGRKPADHDEAAFQGIHAKYVLVVLDEAGGIPEQLYIAADALTTNPGCRILAIGNPDNPATHFKQICEPSSLWHRIRISAFDTPNFTGESVPEELAELLISVSWAEEKAEEWGIDNPIYVSKVLGDFPSQNPNAVVRIADVMACCVDVDTPRTLDELTPVELGIDVGGGGDKTVIRERRGIRAGKRWTSNSDRPEDLAPLVVDCILISDAKAVKIDCIGIGWGLVGELRNRQRRGEFPRDVSIIAVNVAEAATDPKKYVNLRAQIWWEVGRQLSATNGWDLSTTTKIVNGVRTVVAGMEHADSTIAELCEPRWELDASGRIKIESKDDYRKRNSGRSPDDADALLLAFYHPPSADLGSFLDQYTKAARGQ